MRLGVEANQKGSDIEREEPASTFCEGVNEMVRVEAAPGPGRLLGVGDLPLDDHPRRLSARPGLFHPLPHQLILPHRLPVLPDWFLLFQRGHLHRHLEFFGLLRDVRGSLRK